MIFGFCYKNKKGEKYWLHQTTRGRVTLYYFSKDPVGAVPLPPGFVVVENESTGLPVLRKQK
jgi:hypothetical protein